MRSEEAVETELLGLLPKDPETDPTGRRLARLITNVAARRVPVSSFLRIWNLGALQARVTAGYIAYWLRSRFREGGKREQLKSEAHLAAALKLLGTMGYLRGAVMKVGQMLANLPEVMPDEFAQVLSALHFEAPPMHYAMVREVFLDEFGREPEEIFASFEQKAFAAASLGQVHRARLHSGEEVAVKVQYPGIAQTIRNDLKSLRLLLQPLLWGTEWRNTLDKLADIERMLLMEADYEQEARFGEKARQQFTEADRVVVPRVFDAYSSKRVLTTEYLSGCHLGEFLARNPAQAERDGFAALLTMATLRVYYRLHWLMADPNPGNFIFMPDGRLGLIDFGCTRVLTDGEWLLIAEMERANLERDEARFDQALARICLIDNPKGVEPDRLETARRAAYWKMEPWLTEGMFDFGDREFFMRGVDCLMETARQRHSNGSALSLWSSRFIFGGRAVVYQMKGRCEFKKIFNQESAASLFPVPESASKQP